MFAARNPFPDHVLGDATATLRRLAYGQGGCNFAERLIASWLLSPLKDYRTAAELAGYGVQVHPAGGYVWFRQDQGEPSPFLYPCRTEADAWQASCLQGRDAEGRIGLEPFLVPIRDCLEVSAYLGRALDSRGERVAFGFNGQNIWARSAAVGDLAEDPLLIEILGRSARINNAVTAK